MKKSVSIVEDRTWKMYYCPELDILNGKRGEQDLAYFHISNPWKKYEYRGG